MKLTIFVLVALSSFCATLSPVSAATTTAYRCADGTAFNATYVGGVTSPGRVTLKFHNGKTMELPQAPSTDGGRYAKGTTEFWIKGNSGTLTRGKRVSVCK